jgi:4-hydroxy-2-oxoheptanedioate aldolase
LTTVELSAAARGERLSLLRSSKSVGVPTFGAWQCLPSSLSAEILARAGFDWILVDLQHGGAGWGDLLAIIQALELGGAVPLVRVGWNDPMQIMRALDLGASGVIIPMVSTEEDAQRAVAACRYPPTGIRSFGPTRSFYGGASQLGDEALCLAMIETQQGLDNLERIAAVPGLDGLFVGAVDLSLALGCGLTTTPNATVLAAIDQVVAACNRHHLIPGGVALGDGMPERLLSRGMRFLAVGADVAYLDQGARSDAAKAARLRSDGTRANDSGI